MKLFPFYLLYLFCFDAISINAQIEYLRLSPRQKIEQRVGATDITLEFSRPQAKGRTIFGDLVPYDKLWRTGANENTIITFSHRVSIEETEVPAGSYALFTLPRTDTWSIYLYRDINNLDVPNPIDSSKLIFLTQVSAERTDRYEGTMVINLYDLTETSANLGIRWEHTEVRIPISFFTQEAMEKSINEVLKQNAMDFSIAASYYHERNLNLDKAKELQELSIALRSEPNAWAYHSYAIILYKLGDLQDAIEAVKYSLKLAEAANNTYLIRENKALLDKWKQN